MGYEIEGELYEEFPGDLVKLDCVKPKYEWFDGWKQSTAEARTLSELPSAARRYLDRIEALVEAPITYVSVEVNTIRIFILRLLPSSFLAVRALREQHYVDFPHGAQLHIGIGDTLVSVRDRAQK